MRHAKTQDRFEFDFLAGKHMEENPHLMDDAVDDFDEWLQRDVEIEDWIKYAGQFADSETKPLIKALMEIRELVDGAVDVIDNGLGGVSPNMEMKVQQIVDKALNKVGIDATV